MRLLPKRKRLDLRKFSVLPRPMLYRIQRELECQIAEKLRPRGENKRSTPFHE